MEKCEALSTKPEECRYSFFQHTACEFFPCHETAHPEDFNCLFCYCPLYALGDRCGGNFRYIGDGIKDCSGCLRTGFDLSEFNLCNCNVRRAAVPAPRCQK